MPKERRFLPYLIMAIPPLLWAGNFIVGRAVADHMAPVHLSFWRWALATLVLLPFGWRRTWAQRGVIRAHLGAIMVLAFFGISVFNTLAYISLQYTVATNAILLNSLIPIFILIISGLFLGVAIRRWQVFGVIISLAGVLAILTRLDGEVIRSLAFNRGDLWMLLAALDWALYSILLKYLRPKTLEAIPLLQVTMILGTLMLLPLLWIDPFGEGAMVWDGAMIRALAYIAIFPSVLAYLSWNYGIQKIGAATGGQFLHLMPLFGAVMATVFLGEQIELFHWVGALLIGTGIWMSVSGGSKSV